MYEEQISNAESHTFNGDKKTRLLSIIRRVYSHVKQNSKELVTKYSSVQMKLCC